MDWIVKNAVNRDVERQHLNKILAEIRATIDSLKSTKNTTSDIEAIRQVVAAMVQDNTETGITVSYNTLKKVLDFAVSNFTLTLTGDVSGAVTVTGLNSATISTELNAELQGVEDVPIDNVTYWRRNQVWEAVSPMLVSLDSLTDDGFTVVYTDDNGDPQFAAREIEGTAGEVDVVDGTGAEGNPVIGLADVVDSNTGTLQGITVDGKGRVTGTTDATITAGVGIDVVNGDAAAGPPTISHEDTSSVSDLTSDNSNGVVLQDITITFDTFGHVLSVSAGTVDLDTRYLQPGDEAVQSVNGETGIVVLDAADVGADPAGTAAAIITSSITNGDTTHAPSGDAVFDALALKADSSSLPTFGTGTYTPTCTGVLNVSSATGNLTNYMRQGSYVSISGKIAAIPTAGATVTAVDISLPIATVFATNNDASGGCTVNRSTNYITGAFVNSIAGTSTLRLVFISDIAANHDLRFNAIYPILP